MIKTRSLRFWGVVLIAAAAIAFAAPRLVSQGYEKICPISFRLVPSSSLEKSFAAKIEKDNAVLSTFLGELRSNAALRSWAREWLGRAMKIDKRDAAPLAAAASELHKLLQGKDIADPFQGTYLAEPSLTTEKGETVIGIPAVIAELLRIVDASTYIDAQSVHVELEYLPYRSDAYNAQNPPGTAEDRIVDIIGHIKTVLAYAPFDAPVTIGGTAPHRKVCEIGS